MKIQSDKERAEMRAIAELRAQSLPESSAEITWANVIQLHPAKVTTLRLLKYMTDILDTQRRMPAMWSNSEDITWKR